MEKLALKAMAGVMVLALNALPVTSYAGEAEFRQECEARLAGESLVIVTEKALKRGVISARHLAEFAASSDWYNPFTKVDTSLLSARFKNAFDRVALAMSTEERTAYKANLKQLLAKHAAREEVVAENSVATAEAFIFRTLRPPDLAGYESRGTSFSFSIENGRPVIAKPMLRENAHVVLYDPFASEASARTEIFPGLTGRDFDDIPAFFHHNGKTYLVFRQGDALDLSTRSYVNVEPRNRSKILNPIAVSTSKGEALVHDSPPRLHRIDNGYEQLVPGADADYPMCVNRVGDRDIVSAPAGNMLAFRDLSETEKLKPFPFFDMQIYKHVVFEEGGLLLAAIPFMAKDKSGIVVWDLRNGKELRRLSTPTVDTLHVIRDNGKTFIAFTRNGKMGGFIPLEGGEPTSLPELPKTGMVRLHAMGRDFVAWALGNRLYIYDLLDGGVTSAAIEGLQNAGAIQTFTHDGFAHAVIDDTSGFPKIVQVTGRTK